MLHLQRALAGFLLDTFPLYPEGLTAGFLRYIGDHYPRGAPPFDGRRQCSGATADLQHVQAAHIPQRRQQEARAGLLVRVIDLAGSQDAVSVKVFIHGSTTHEGHMLVMVMQGHA